MFFKLLYLKSWYCKIIDDHIFNFKTPEHFKTTDEFNYWSLDQSWHYIYLDFYGKLTKDIQDAKTALGLVI